MPELAARLHTAALPAVILRAKEHFKALKAIAVTNEPGLSVSLLPGIVAAKALAAALNLPLISVNHLVGAASKWWEYDDTGYQQNWRYIRAWSY